MEIMKWDDLDIMIKKCLEKNNIVDSDISWIRIEPDSFHINIVMIGFENKYGIQGSRD